MSIVKLYNKVVRYESKNTGGEYTKCITQPVLYEILSFSYVAWEYVHYFLQPI